MLNKLSHRGPLTFIFLVMFTVLAFAGGKPAKQVQVKQVSPNIADLSEVMSPTVVYIENIEQRTESRGNNSNNPFFENFPFFQQEQGPSVGAGSGVIFHPDGYIITNNHVVENARELRVTLTDGRTFPGKVIGTDSELDMAVIQIEADNFTYARMGDSDKVRVGDWVVAIGNPLGYRYSVTAGIVSALGRGGDSVGLNAIENYIQTDAAINRGNSGGPLLDMNGEVVGINTVVSATAQNIGFAIPSNMIMASARQILETGKVSRGAIGVSLGVLSTELKDYYSVNQAALVQGVNPNSPAEKAGLQPGDLITEFDGKKVHNRGHLISLVALHQPGDQIRIKVLRPISQSGAKIEMKTLNLNLELGDRSLILASDNGNRFRRIPGNTDGSKVVLPKLGIEIERVDTTSRRRYQLGQEEQGYVITDVAQDSSAYLNGVRPGMIIRQINNQDLNSGSVRDLVSNLEKNDRTVLLTVEGDGGVSRFVGVRPEKN